MFKNILSKFLGFPALSHLTHKWLMMARTGLMVIVRTGVRRSEIARMRGIGRFRQVAPEGAVAFADGLRTS